MSQVLLESKLVEVCDASYVLEKMSTHGRKSKLVYMAPALCPESTLV